MPFFSDGLALQLGITGQDIINDVHAFISRCHPDDIEKVKQAIWESARNLTDFRQRVGRFKDNNEKYHYLSWYSHPTRLDDGTIVWEGVVLDETEEHEKEIALDEARNRLELATQAAGLGIWDADIKTGKIIWDKGMTKIYGVDGNQSLMTKEEWSSFIHPEDLDALNQQDNFLVNSDSKIYKGNFRIIRNDNSIRHIETLGLIDRNKKGEVMRMTGINMDRTTERVYEQKLLQSLHEKEILIKEIHHRIKNNLQLISSMIFIKASEMEASAEKVFLEEMRLRIKSIAIIHERLLQTGSLNKINIADYLNMLLNNIMQSTADSKNTIRFDKSIEDHEVELDMAIHCGLIVNEMITHSIKHAFQDQAEGIITIHLKRENDEYMLVVADNGKGLPESIKPGHGSFGMEMLDVFISQINASLEISREGGTAYTMRFK